MAGCSLMIYVDEEFKEKVTNACEAQGRPVSKVVKFLLEKWLKNEYPVFNDEKEVV